MTATEEELVKFNNKLKKVSDGLKETEEAYGVFEVLEKLELDGELINVIHRSNLAVTINELRKKTKDEKLAKRGKTLIRKWKVHFENQQTKVNQAKKDNKAEGKQKKKEKQRSTTPASDDNDSNSNTPPVRKSSNSKSAPNSSLLNSNLTFHKQAMPKDEKRARIATVLLSSFQKGGDLPDGTQDPEEVAARVEAALYERFGDTNAEYINASRSLASNLRDKKNPDLRLNVLTGAVSAKRFANMTTAEMASDAMKQQRDSFNKEAILEHQMSVNEGTPSDMFRCGKCGKNNCTYTQLQTRSADEPMTTFVFCRTCGNRWKFC